MNHRTVGTCGSCGGAVTVPTAWHGIYPPTPTCRKCGATPVENHGPVLPMQPPRGCDAQAFARHANPATTHRYLDERDQMNLEAQAFMLEEL